MDTVDFDPSTYTSYELVEIASIIDHELERRALDEAMMAQALDDEEEISGY